MSSAEDREFVQSLAKGLAVIEAFGPDLPAMTLSEVARKTKLSPGSARRVLRTLQRLGYMQSDGQRFALAPRTLQLGYAYLASQPFTSLVQPRLAQLTQKVEGICSVSVLDGTDVVYIARATNKRIDTVTPGAAPEPLTHLDAMLYPCASPVVSLLQHPEETFGRRLHPPVHERAAAIPPVTPDGGAAVKLDEVALFEAGVALGVDPDPHPCADGWQDPLIRVVLVAGISHRGPRDAHNVALAHVRRVHAWLEVLDHKAHPRL